MDASSSLDLRRNAYDFLVESINNAERAADDATIWKFAIVNIAQAIELLLKERLRLEHHLLVYIDVDRRQQTVGVDKALARLEACGVSFENEDIVRIKRARDIRNNIVHYDITVNAEQLRGSYVDLFEFIHVFHIASFGDEIHGHIGEDLWVSEAAFMEEFRRDFVQYQGAKMIKTFPSEILDSQFILAYVIEGRSYRRIRWRKPAESQYMDCRDCGVIPGQLHTPNCDNEICPRCGWQWLSCGCGDNAELEYAEEIGQWIVDQPEDGDAIPVSAAPGIAPPDPGGTGTPA